MPTVELLFNLSDAFNFIGEVELAKKFRDAAEARIQVELDADA